jgi:nitronate monooxygenase
VRTWLSDRFGLSIPVVGAPMFGVGAGRLAAGVSAAGGLGVIGVGGTTTPEWVTEQTRIAAASGAPYGVGFMAWALDRDDRVLTAALDASPALVSISFGTIAPYVDAARAAGAVVASQAGTLAEATAAADAGVDVVVARGAEAGGHGRNDVGTLPLLQEVLDRVAVPVLAAGGIATARGLAAVLAAGAAGAWVGTAFLACEEADTSAAAADRLLAAADTDTAYGRVFDIGQRLGWPPEYGGRALRNAFFDAWEGREDQLAEDDAAAQRLADAKTSGDYDTAYIYAGQGAAMLRRRRTVADVMAEFAGAQRLLADAASRIGDAP